MKRDTVQDYVASELNFWQKYDLPGLADDSEVACKDIAGVFSGDDLPRDKHQRRTYAMRRMSLALDQVLQAENPDEKNKYGRWAVAWAMAAAAI